MISLYLLFQFVIVTLNVAAPEPPRFFTQTIDDNVSIGYGLALGDVNGDGKPDILLADKKQFVWYRNGDWKRFVMIENLTLQDNVCIAARDLDGDGKVEVAVGAQWNPGETSDTTKSGSVHYLIPPEDRTGLWEAVELHHEPTIHRMRWIKSGGKCYLVVLPLHGRGNRNGEGEGVNIMAYEFPKNPRDRWNIETIDNSMHLTHNLAVAEIPAAAALYIAGKEGLRRIDVPKASALLKNVPAINGLNLPTGEVRIANFGRQKIMATIEPMHGVSVAVYLQAQNWKRIVLDDQLKEGHALATADFLGLGLDQVVAGWRNPNAENKTGIKIYVPKGISGEYWDSFWIDENGMATEDLQVLDMNGDGKVDIVASGRASKNLKIYWNKN